MIRSACFESLPACVCVCVRETICRSSGDLDISRMALYSLLTSHTVQFGVLAPVFRQKTSPSTLSCLHDADKQFKYELQRMARVSLGYISSTEILKNGLLRDAALRSQSNVFYARLLLGCIDPGNSWWARWGASIQRRRTNVIIFLFSFSIILQRQCWE